MKYNGKGMGTGRLPNRIATCNSQLLMAVSLPIELSEQIDATDHDVKRIISYSGGCLDISTGSIDTSPSESITLSDTASAKVAGA